MELRLDFFDGLSAFSYGLIALSYAMRDIKWLRIFMILACAVDIIVYYGIRPGQPMWVQLLMSILLIAINVYQLVALWKETQSNVFDEEAKLLYDRVFYLLTPGEFRRLLKVGSFETLQAGDTLLSKDKRADAISVVVAGELDVRLGDNTLSKIHVGGFAGEMSYFTGQAASVNVCAAVKTQTFRIGHREFETLRDKYPEMHIKLTGILGRDISEKLRQATAFIDDQSRINSLISP